MFDSREQDFTPHCSRWDPDTRPIKRQSQKKTRNGNGFSFCLLMFLCGWIIINNGTRPVLAADAEKQGEPDWTYVQMQPDDVHQGDLILINQEYACTFPNVEKLVVVSDTKSESYLVKNEQEKLLPQTVEALNSLMDDFLTVAGSVRINVISTYRSYELQQQLFSQYSMQMGVELASHWSARPGHSEHHSGLALDLGAYQYGVTQNYDGQGVYSWIGENCHTYGFIVRYAPDKADITGIYSEPWHLRYVGVPHAALMAQRQLCMEEYIEWLKGFSWEGDHLYYGMESGVYEIYYVAAEEDGTTVPVPTSGEYSISGNNVDGFIVTAYFKDGIPERTEKE